MAVRGRTRQARSLVFLAALAATSWAASGPAKTTSGHPRLRRASIRASSRRISRRAGRCPESVLAVIDQARASSRWRISGVGWKQVPRPRGPIPLPRGVARRFLDLLIDKELLAARAGQETWEWSAVESAEVAGLRDRTMMRVCPRLHPGRRREPEGAARRAAALGGGAGGGGPREHRGDLAHDAATSCCSRASPGLGRRSQASPDSSIWSRLKIDGPRCRRSCPPDSGRVVGWSSVGPGAGRRSCCDAWAKLNPIFRPRIESPEQCVTWSRTRCSSGCCAARRWRATTTSHRHGAAGDAAPGGVPRHAVLRDPRGRSSHDPDWTMPTLRRYYDKNPAAWGDPDPAARGAAS